MPGWLLKYIRTTILKMDATEFSNLLQIERRTLSRWERGWWPLPFHAEFRPHRIILVHDHSQFANGLRFIIFERGAVPVERA